ncbi:hypothetical protein AMECASPLE_011249, partial [Ameca splendens]
VPRLKTSHAQPSSDQKALRLSVKSTFLSCSLQPHTLCNHLPARSPTKHLSASAIILPHPYWMLLSHPYANQPSIILRNLPRTLTPLPKINPPSI